MTFPQRLYRCKSLNVLFLVTQLGSVMSEWFS
uniref:Uncharacterized protein n=1 Tax=Anguilla anguilla TaxID=7936 RepID=A0A0E9W6K2_ANGAN